MYAFAKSRILTFNGLTILVQILFSVNFSKKSYFKKFVIMNIESQIEREQHLHWYCDKWQPVVKREREREREREKERETNL